MNIFHHVSSVREALKQARLDGHSVGFVPTMGNLHDAHLDLVKQAQRVTDVVIVSIFVNRLQFGLNEDWDQYPRTLTEDINKLQAIGCNYLFCPDESEIYPNGMDEQTRVYVPSMTNVLCGKSRPGHFDGVTTVVSKLFNIVQPDIAVFGEKDFQQIAIIRRMVEDLCMPVEIHGGATIREPDGLAMSSRNSFILAEERSKVTVLHKSLTLLCDKIRSGERDFAVLQRLAWSDIEVAGFKPDYVSICNSKTLLPAAHDDVNITVLGAMYTANARLIDNISVDLNACIDIDK